MVKEFRAFRVPSTPGATHQRRLKTDLLLRRVQGKSAPDHLITGYSDYRLCAEAKPSRDENLLGIEREKNGSGLSDLADGRGTRGQLGTGLLKRLGDHVEVGKNGSTGTGPKRILGKNKENWTFIRTTTGRVVPKQKGGL